MAMLLKPLKWLLDVILPPTCLSCQCMIKTESFSGGLCLRCWANLVPFNAENAYAQAMLEESPIAQFYTPFIYSDVTGTLVRRLKYTDGLQTAGFMAQQMLPFVNQISPDILVPVPLHWQRLYHRKYNQSAELVRRLAKASGARWDKGNLQRIRKTPSQVGQSEKVRRQQLKNAFKASGYFKGKSVLLVDDVCTTGSTAYWCAEALLAAGATKVDLLTFAYVEPKV